MADPKLNFLHVCENALVSRDGKLSIIGIFNQIGTNSFPAFHAKLSIVTSIGGPVGEYQETIEIVSPDELVIAKAENKVVIEDGGGAANFIADFIGIVFPKAGKYVIRVQINGKVINQNNSIVLRN